MSRLSFFTAETIVTVSPLSKYIHFSGKLVPSPDRSLASRCASSRERTAMQMRPTSSAASRSRTTLHTMPPSWVSSFTRHTGPSFATLMPNKTFTNDIMPVAVRGPNHRPLQVLDLPGLVAFGEYGQGEEYFLKDLVTRYMDAKQSVILVITSNRDLNTHPVLALISREYIRP